VVLADLAPHQQAMCRIFDNMYQWMLNAYNTPFVAYVGEIDGSFSKHVAARRQLSQEEFHFEGESFTTRRPVVNDSPSKWNYTGLSWRRAATGLRNDPSISPT
jgi:hypothetical protein